LILLLAIAGFIGYGMIVGGKLDARSKAYVDESVPAIVSNWSVDELKKRESPQFRDVTSDEELARVFQKFSVLGPLQKYEGCEGASRVNINQSGRHITAEYVARATFQNGKAEIDINLILNDGVWQILGFRVTSDALLR
jgi:hypothetical protein